MLILNIFPITGKNLSIICVSPFAFLTFWYMWCSNFSHSLLERVIERHLQTKNVLMLISTFDSH